MSSENPIIYDDLHEDEGGRYLEIHAGGSGGDDEEWVMGLDTKGAPHVVDLPPGYDLGPNMRVYFNEEGEVVPAPAQPTTPSTEENTDV